MDDNDRLNSGLNEIWRSCRKIQDTIFRYGIDICSEFCVHDPKRNGLISESIFTNILAKYKNIIGISCFELREVTDYFRTRDGRISYQQFCKVICEEGQDHSRNKNLVHGLEWNDPMHVNLLTNEKDKRLICLLLIKIAQTSHMPLMPYFQDYELVSQNVGTVTVAHFSRVLHFMKIQLSDSDFMLLLKRYMKDSYTVNYVAFVKHLQAVMDYLKEHKLVDHSEDIINNFPGKIVELDFPQLPHVNGKRFGVIFPEMADTPVRSDCDLVFRIQRFVSANRVRIHDFLDSFDLLKTGTITRTQFVRGMDRIGLMKILNELDIEAMCRRYADPIDESRVHWRVFRDDIDRVFTEKHLNKQPELAVESPPKYINKMLRDGQISWLEAPEAVRDLCEEALARIRTKIRTRRIYLHPFFKDYDRLNCGHVRCHQANQVLLSNGILLSDEEFESLNARYGNDLGFSYVRFLEDADPAEYAVPKMKGPLPLKEKLVECPERKEAVSERDKEAFLIKALANAKRQAIVKSIQIADFLQDYDRHRENHILEVDFRRGLDNANIKLTVPEMDAICTAFQSPSFGCSILYREFVKAMDEIFIQTDSTDNVISMPLKHFANLDCLQCFMNFEDRTIASHALQKLARYPDEISNLSSVFKDFDRENCGTITQHQFLRGLTVREVHTVISSREFDVLCKCFGSERGLQVEFDYRQFLNILDILHKTGQIRRHN